jgi:hypothetical protein
VEGTQNGVGKKFGMSRSLVEDYLMIYENRDKIRQKLNIDAMASHRIGSPSTHSIFFVV